MAGFSRRTRTLEGEARDLLQLPSNVNTTRECLLHNTAINKTTNYNLQRLQICSFLLLLKSCFLKHCKKVNLLVSRQSYFTPSGLHISPICLFTLHPSKPLNFVRFTISPIPSQWTKDRAFTGSQLPLTSQDRRQVTSFSFTPLFCSILCQLYN